MFPAFREIPCLAVAFNGQHGRVKGCQVEGGKCADGLIEVLSGAADGTNYVLS